MRQLTVGTPAFYILLSLSSGELHGYEMMKRVEKDSHGAVHMGPATLYTTIKRLLEAGYLAESDERPDASMDDQRRRYYRLTPSGRDLVREELREMDSLVRRFSPGLV